MAMSVDWCNGAADFGLHMLQAELARSLIPMKLEKGEDEHFAFMDDTIGMLPFGR